MAWYYITTAGDKRTIHTPQEAKAYLENYSETQINSLYREKLPIILLREKLWSYRELCSDQNDCI